MGISEVRARDLITEFYTQLPQEFTELSFKQINEICRAPWAFLRKLMHNGKFEKVRFKYFGVFSVRLVRAKYELRSRREGFEAGRIYPEVYFPLKENLETYIAKHELDTD